MKKKKISAGARKDGIQGHSFCFNREKRENIDKM